MKKNKLALLVALAMQHLSSPAFAQTTSVPSMEASLPEIKVLGGRELGQTYNLPTSVSATKIEAPLRDIPQTINVVPQQVIRDQNALSLESVLKYVPGVGLSNGDGQRDQVTIRGFSAISDQFVDGIRDDALYFRDLSNIEQVEVIKGPASVLYGRGSSGGLINRITKKPGVNKSEVSATVGSWNQRRGDFDLARDYSENGSGVAFRLTGAIEKADSYRDQQFLDRNVISPSLLFKFNSSSSLLLQAERLSDRRVTDFGIPSFQGSPVNVSSSTYYGAANARDVDYTQTDVTSYGFTFDHKFNDQLSLRNAFRYYDYTSDRNNTLVTSVNEAAQTARLTHSSFRRKDDGYSNQTELTQKLDLAGMKHQILYGIELGKQNKGEIRTANQNAGDVNLFRPVLPVVARTVSGEPTTLSDMDTSSFYLQDLVTLSDQWKALAGVRYDKFEQRTRNTATGSRLERTDREWSPRVGLVYQPTTTQSYYASYSKSFQPSAENFPLQPTNEDITPEETTNKEIGAKFDFFNGLASATASLFQLERTNIKSAVPGSNPVVILPIGTQRTNGLELTFTGDLSNGWQVWTGYSYLDAKVTSSLAIDSSDNRTAFKNISVEGKRATLTPKHSANLWVTKRFGNYRAGAGMNYVDDRFANAGNTVTLPSYTTVDAMFGYKLAGLDLQLNINNIFDRGYIVSGHGTSPNLNTPGAPRNAQLTARYNF